MPMSHDPIEQSLAEAALAVGLHVGCLCKGPCEHPAKNRQYIYCRDLHAEVAQLRQERDKLIISHDDGHANYASERIRRDALETRLAVLTAAISETMTDTTQLVALAQAHRQDSESVDVFEAAKDAAETRLATLTAALEGLESRIRKVIPEAKDFWRDEIEDWADRLSALRVDVDGH